MNEIVKNTIDKIIQLYMENDYDYVVSKAKVGSKLLEREDDHMMQFLIRNSILPADMSAEDIQQVADISSKRIDEIDSEIYRVYGKSRYEQERIEANRLIDTLEQEIDDLTGKSRLQRRALTPAESENW